MRLEATGSYDFGTFRQKEHELARLAHQARVGSFADRAIWSRTGLVDGMDVLDLACGSGQVTCALAQAVPRGRVTGVDLSEPLLQEARRHAVALSLQNVSFTLADVYDLVLDAGPFDYVYVRLLFQHLNRPLPALASISRVMKPGGRLCIVDVDDDWLLFEPEPETFKPFIRAAAEGQALRGGDRHVGRKLPGYLMDCGFRRVRLDVMPVSSFDIGLKNFLDITTRFKLEQLSEPDRPWGEIQMKRFYDAIDNPRAWAVGAAFVASAIKGDGAGTHEAFPETREEV